MLENNYIELIPSKVSLVDEVLDYYKRNREFLEEFAPLRNEEFYSYDYQKKMLENEEKERINKTSYRFYIKLVQKPKKIIGVIALNNVVWGPFCSAFLGYKLDKEYINKGYMTMAVAMLVDYSFNELKLHRIEANVMPKNKASLKVLKNNNFQNEGIS